jgi:hypothetical protein
MPLSRWDYRHIPPCSTCCLRWGLANFLPGLVSNYALHDFCLLSSWITSVWYHTNGLCCFLSLLYFCWLLPIKNVYLGHGPHQIVYVRNEISGGCLGLCGIILTSGVGVGLATECVMSADDLCWFHLYTVAVIYWSHKGNCLKIKTLWTHAHTHQTPTKQKQRKPITESCQQRQRKARSDQ